MFENAYQPLVSIIINNYNYGIFLSTAIESVLQQTYTNIEIIVVDDGSTDHSRTVISEYGEKIVAVFKENGGQSSALNSGFASSTGEIICLLDADDRFLPDKVENIIQVFAEHPEVQWCFHRLQLVDLNANPLLQLDSTFDGGIWDYREAIAQGSPIPYIPTATSGLCFRRSVTETILPLPESIKITSDNYLKFSASALAIGFFCNQVLAVQQIHGNNAYTLKDNNHQVKAEVLIATAFCMRRQFPALTKFTNGLLILGIKLSPKLDDLGIEYRTMIQDYLKFTNLIGYFKIQSILFQNLAKQYARKAVYG